MGKKILITGAAGFIGSHLVDLLLEEGVAVSDLRLMIPKKESLKNLPKKKFDIVYGDIRDKRAVSQAMRGVNVVYHLAARIDFDGKTIEDYRDVNVEGTKNLLDCCRGKEIQKFVFFSSIGVFGLPAQVGDIKNWSETHPKTYSNLYGQSKYEAEEAVLNAFKENGTPYAIIRPASVYGPREKGPTLELYKVIKKRLFIIVGNGKNKLHYIFVKDLVKGARQAQLSRKQSGDYILAGSEPTSLEDLTYYIGKSIGINVFKVYLPKNFMLILSYIIDSIFKLFGVKSPIFPDRIRTMTTTYYYNISKAKREIKYNPKVSFEEGAKITGKWYLENNYI